MVFERLEAERDLPDMHWVDNGTEILGQMFVEWCQANGVFIDYIETGKRDQKAFIKRFKRSLHDEVHYISGTAWVSNVGENDYRARKTRCRLWAL